MNAAVYRLHTKYTEFLGHWVVIRWPCSDGKWLEIYHHYGHSQADWLFYSLVAFVSMLHGNWLYSWLCISVFNCTSVCQFQRYYLPSVVGWETSRHECSTNWVSAGIEGQYCSFPWNIEKLPLGKSGLHLYSRSQMVAEGFRCWGYWKGADNMAVILSLSWLDVDRRVVILHLYSCSPWLRNQLNCYRQEYHLTDD